MKDIDVIEPELHCPECGDRLVHEFDNHFKCARCSRVARMKRIKFTKQLILFPKFDDLEYKVLEAIESRKERGVLATALRVELGLTSIGLNKSLLKLREYGFIKALPTKLVQNERTLKTWLYEAVHFA